MKKAIILAATLLFSAFALNAQTNVQLHYDLGGYMYHGKDGHHADLSKGAGSRQIITTTVEHWNGDKYGSNFFFIDLDYGGPNPAGKNGIKGAYWEISRELCFWHIADKFNVTAHLEYNGGLSNGGSYDDAWLFGPTFAFNNSDYSFTASITAMYKVIPGNIKSMHNFQLTVVWNYHFCNDMFLFSGFADFWKENRPWQMGAKGDKQGDGTDFIFLSEPQFWFNIHALKGAENVNLSVGTEVELSNNFVGTGFYAIPTLALKYTF